MSINKSYNYEDDLIMCPTCGRTNVDDPDRPNYLTDEDDNHICKCGEILNERSR